MEDFYVQKRTMQWKIPGSRRMWRGKTQDIEIKEGGIHCVPCASSSVLGAAIEVFLTKLGGCHDFEKLQLFRLEELY